MSRNDNSDTFEIIADVFREKADRIISVLNNINRQGGIVTQLMMFAACIEGQDFLQYLHQITYTYSEKGIDGKPFIPQSGLEKYIRLFRNTLYDLNCFDNSNRRKEEIDLFMDFKLEVYGGCYPRLDNYSNDLDSLDSWLGDREEGYSMQCEMIYDILYSTISAAILDIESIVQLIREEKEKNVANNNSKNFREFIKDKERTDEILKKIKLLIGNKKNSNALKIITRAWWIGWLDSKPSAPSIKAEFPSITCTDQLISQCLKEEKPTKNGKIDVEAIEIIRKEYEAV